MIITGDDTKRITSVYLGLSETEARELRSALDELETAEDGWHAHIYDVDYRHELTVYREDDDTARIYD